MQVVGRASLGALEGVLLGFAGRPNLLKVRHDVVTPATRKWLELDGRGIVSDPLVVGSIPWDFLKQLPMS